MEAQQPASGGGTGSTGGTEGGGGLDFSPSDVSFLYKGYAPISIRLVEQALRPAGWAPLAEVRGEGERAEGLSVGEEGGENMGRARDRPWVGQAPIIAVRLPLA